MKNQTYDVIVVGGGIIGLTSALLLADQGQQVLLCDAAEFGQQASWAGGGILMPLYPWRFSEQLNEFYVYSLSQLKLLLERLRKDTDIDPELYECGLWVLGLDEEETDAFEQWADRCQIVRYCVDTATAPLHFRNVSDRHFFLPEVKNIRNPRLLKALVACLTQHPMITLMANTAITQLRVPSAQMVEVLAGQTVLTARKLVVASGAWGRQLSEQLQWSLSVYPVLGQMLLLQAHMKPLNSMVLAHGRYLIPRKDGRILVGSTVEQVGFRKSFSKEGYSKLKLFAESLLGSIEDICIEAQWAGLRPGSERELPYIRAHPKHAHVWVNVGHFRNGLVLAAGSARVLSEKMSGEYSSLSSWNF